MKLAALITLAALALVACGGTAKRNDARYDAQLEFVKEQRNETAKLAAEKAAQRDARFAAQRAACGTDARCVEHVSSNQTIADVVAELAGSGREAAAAAMPAPPYERDGAAKFRDIAAGVTQVAQPLASAWVNKVQSDNSVRLAEHQYDFLGSAIGSMADVARDAQPNVTVGGDYVPGSQHIGDNVTGDGNATRGSHVGDNVGRDQTGGDHVEVIESVVGNENRNNSPGPFDNIGNCNAGSGAPGGIGGEGDGSPGAPGGTGGGCAPPTTPVTEPPPPPAPEG